jgi:hypothetical protein
MKTNVHSNVNATKWVLYLLVTFLTLLLVGRVNAQRKVGGPSDLFFGIEGTQSTRNFHINSDLANLKGINTIQTGQTIGIVGGGNLFMSRISIGSFHSQSNDNTPLRLSTVEVGTNFFPFQAIKEKARSFEPYMVASIDQSMVKSTGTFTPTVIAGAGPSGTGCGCPGNPGSGSSSGSGILSDPDHPGVTPTPITEQYSGKIITRRVNLGVGIRFHAVQRNHFLNLFAEVRKGVSVGTETTSVALGNTSSSGQLAIDFGLAIGLTKSKSGGFFMHARRK